MNGLNKLRGFLFCLLVILIAYPLSGQNPIRIEPPNWWTDMEKQQIQLMIHADSISKFRVVKSSSPFLKVKRTHTLESPNYLFVDLEIDDNLDPGTQHLWLSDPLGKTFKIDYPILKRKENPLQSKGFDASDVIYLIMPDRFSNGDENNDTVTGLKEGRNRTIPYGRHGGDIQGIIDRLDYLKDLGISAIWSTPLLLDDEKTYSYHGYAISDYYQIDPRYGSNADYRQLAEECHKRDIKLIMDMVPNHCAASHWWMNDLPQRDWIHQFDTFTRSNHRKTTLNDPYADKKDKKVYSEGWFDISMPDLNQSNEFLLTYLIQNAIWWVEFANLDGLRVDTYLYNDKWPIARWTKAIREEFPGINIVGECWQESVAEMAYWQSGVENYDHYDSYLPSIMDFELNKAINIAFNEDEQHWNQGVARLYNVLNKDYLYSDAQNLMIFGDNHDMTRLATALGNDIAKYKLAFSFLLTTRGIPQIYYGSEIMMDGDKSKGDGDLRKGFPGGWPEHERNAFLSSGRSINEHDIYEHIKTLLQWRKTCKAVQFGELIHYVPENNIYVYFRMHGQERVMVILNNNKDEKVLDCGRFRDNIPRDKSWFSVLEQKKYPSLNDIQLAPKSAKILQLINDEE
jgi:glycosidase